MLSHAEGIIPQEEKLYHGNTTLVEVKANTRVVVIDGTLTVGTMRNNVTLITQQQALTTPLTVIVANIIGVGAIDAAGDVYIQNPFQDQVTVKAKNSIKADDVGDNANFTATEGSIKVGKVGDGSTFIANKKITATTVGSGCALSSNTSSISVVSIDNNCAMTAKSDLTVSRSTGASCALNSESNIFIFGDIGSGSSLDANRGVVCGGSIGANTAVFSEDKISVGGKVDDSCAILADKEIKVRSSVGMRVTMVSLTDKIEIGRVRDDKNDKHDFGRGGKDGNDDHDGNDKNDCVRVGTGSEITAHAGIEIAADLAQSVHLTATDGPLKLIGDVGSQSVLDAENVITIKGNIRDEASVKCIGGTIDITGRVSESATLEANKIIINGRPQNQAQETSAPSANKINRREYLIRAQSTFWKKADSQTHLPSIPAGMRNRVG